MNAAFIFPGQGSQRAGMLDAVPELDSLDRLLDAAEAFSGRELRYLAHEGTPHQLADTRVAQPLLYLADWAWGTTLVDLGIRPVALAGHSLGEFAALALAGVYSVEAGLELLCERARLMSEATGDRPGTMAAVLGLDTRVISDAIAEVDDVWVANDNSPGQVVISGAREAVERAGDVLLVAGARRVVPLDVAGAFHSPMMARASEGFSALLDGVELRDAAIPVIQNTRPEPTTTAAEIRTALSSQMVSPVRWSETMRAFARYAPITLIEAGPGSVLRGLARRVPEIDAVSVEETGVQALVEEVLR